MNNNKYSPPAELTLKKYVAISLANQSFNLDPQFKMCPFGCSSQHTVLFGYKH